MHPSPSLREAELALSRRILLLQSKFLSLEIGRTLSIPSINAVSMFLATIRNRLDNRETAARDAEHLQHLH